MAAEDVADAIFRAVSAPKRAVYTDIILFNAAALNSMYIAIQLSSDTYNQRAELSIAQAL
mgnify:CR=1 FL=1